MNDNAAAAQLLIDIFSNHHERRNMIETKKFVRKPIPVDGVKVTPENMEAVAEWCHGEIRSKDGVPYIKVRVTRSMNERQTMAYVDDWVLYATTGFKVYMPKPFEKQFDPVVEDGVQELDFDEAEIKANVDAQLEQSPIIIDHAKLVSVNLVEDTPENRAAGAHPITIQEKA